MLRNYKEKFFKDIKGLNPYDSYGAERILDCWRQFNPCELKYEFLLKNILTLCRFVSHFYMVFVRNYIMKDARFKKVRIAFQTLYCD